MRSAAICACLMYAGMFGCAFPRTTATNATDRPDLSSDVSALKAQLDDLSARVLAIVDANVQTDTDVSLEGIHSETTTTKNYGSDVWVSRFTVLGLVFVIPIVVLIGLIAFLRKKRTLTVGKGTAAITLPSIRHCPVGDTRSDIDSVGVLNETRQQ